MTPLGIGIRLGSETSDELERERERGSDQGVSGAPEPHRLSDAEVVSGSVRH